MKKLLLLLLGFFTTNQIFAAGDTTRVLFIGNSFTYVEDVPGLVKGLSEQAGHPFEFFMHAPGGISVGDVGQGTDAHMNNPLVFAAIRSKKWDFVVVQDNQGRFVDGGGIFPPTSGSKVIEGHLKIRDSVRANWPCARMLWFSGWAWKDGAAGLGNGEKLIRNIYENYLVLNDTAHEIISPIGSAWLRAIQQVPSVDLWSPDLAHQSLAGSYVTASVIYSSIFRKSPENVLFSGGLDTAVARKLRRIGYEAVVDSFLNTGLSVFAPALTQNGNQLTVTAGASSYEWYKNGTLLAGTTNTITLSGAGVYQVVVKNSATCKARSMAKVISTTTSVNAMTFNDAVSIYPNPVSDELVVKMKDGDIAASNIIVSNATGGVIYRNTFVRETNVPFNLLPPGIYFIAITNEHGRFTTKVIKN